MWVVIITCAAFVNCGLTSPWISERPQSLLKQDCPAAAELILRLA